MLPDVDLSALLLRTAAFLRDYFLWLVGAIVIVAVCCLSEWLGRRRGWREGWHAHEAYERDAARRRRFEPPFPPVYWDRSTVTPQSSRRAEPAESPPKSSPPPATAQPVRAPVRVPSEMDEITSSFNEGGDGLRALRTEVLTVTNSDEILEDPGIRPRFAPSPTGSYLLVLRGDGNSGLVVPKPRLVVTRNQFRYAAFGSVFKTNPPRADVVYRQLHLLCPARAERHGESWELTEPGEAQLGGEEQAV